MLSKEKVRSPRERGRPERSGPALLILIPVGFIGKCEGRVNRFRSYDCFGSVQAHTHNADKKNPRGKTSSDPVNGPRSLIRLGVSPGDFLAVSSHFRQRVGMNPSARVTGFHLSLPAPIQARS